MTKRDWVWLISILAILQMGQFFSTTWLRQTGGAGQALTATPNVQYLIVPICPADLSSMEFGGVCKNLSTGAICLRDASGVFNLRGGGAC